MYSKCRCLLNAIEIYLADKLKQQALLYFWVALLKQSS